MSGRVLQFESGVHKVVDALLPWYVNGTLEGDELEYVQRHLVECSQCVKEAEWLRELYAACIASEVMPGTSGPLRKLRRALEAPPPTKPGFSAGVRREWRSGNAWARWSVAASLALVVLLASVLRDTDAPALYRTLGASSSTSHTSGSLIVVFDPAATEADLRRILRAAGTRLVDGPTQSNAYVLDVPTARRQDALRALRAERAVVFVEQLGPEDGQ